MYTKSCQFINPFGWLIIFQVFFNAHSQYMYYRSTDGEGNSPVVSKKHVISNAIHVSVITTKI